jgi:hypothetical protein
MQRTPLGVSLQGYVVRKATAEDAAACNALCRRVHGFERSGEVAYAIAQNTARVVEHLRRVTGYATEIGHFAHAVGETNDDLKALIGPGARLRPARLSAADAQP